MVIISYDEKPGIQAIENKYLDLTPSLGTELLLQPLAHEADRAGDRRSSLISAVALSEGPRRTAETECPLEAGDVGIHHHLDQLLELDGRLPAQLGAGLRRVAEQVIHLGKVDTGAHPPRRYFS